MTMHIYHCQHTRTKAHARRALWFERWHACPWSRRRRGGRHRRRGRRRGRRRRRGRCWRYRREGGGRQCGHQCGNRRRLGRRGGSCGGGCLRGLSQSDRTQSEEKCMLHRLARTPCRTSQGGSAMILVQPSGDAFMPRLCQRLKTGRERAPRVASQWEGHERRCICRRTAPVDTYSSLAATAAPVQHAVRHHRTPGVKPGPWSTEGPECACSGCSSACLELAQAPEALVLTRTKYFSEALQDRKAGLPLSGERRLVDDDDQAQPEQYQECGACNPSPSGCPHASILEIL